MTRSQWESLIESPVACRSTPREGVTYAGAAFIALDDCARAEFFDVLDRLATSKALFKATRLSDVRWCVPKLIVRVKHLAVSKTL